MNNSKYPTVLVTGAAGGIGWTVTKMLLEKGCQVVAFDDYTTGLTRNEAPGLTWQDADIADPAIADKLNQYPIDAIVHLAARLADQSMKAPAADVRTNAFGAMQIFEWAATHDVKRVVFTSSSAVYGHPPETPIKETDPVRAETIYAACKLACESFLRMLGDPDKGYGLPWTVVRCFATYGPSHKPSKTQGILNVMTSQLLEGNEVIVKGSLDRVRDLVYVDDTARAIVECLFSDGAKNQIFNVGTGKEYTVREMIYSIAAALGRTPEDLDIKELDGTPGDPRYCVANVDAIRTAVGYESQVDLNEGIARLVAARTS
jgi:UDP-glucose 4-epimerase